MEPPARPRLGEVLRKQQLISEEELVRALEVQEETGRPLGEILVEHLNVVSIAALRDALVVQQRWRPLGQMLVERQILTEEQLLQALDEQEETGRQLGDILRERFYIASSTLDELLREQHEIELELDRGYASGLRAALLKRTRPGGDATPRETELAQTVVSTLTSRLGSAISDPHLHIALRTVEKGEQRIASLNDRLAKQRSELDHLRDVLADRELTIAELRQRIAELEPAGA
jgi:hypothetical protein